LLVLDFCAIRAAAAVDENPPTTPANTPSLQELRSQATIILGALPEKMPGASADTPARVALGRRLYFDKQLSVNETISCNSCHVLDNRGPGVDGQPTSLGAFGKRGGRNSPTTLNAGFHFAQFWDGRATNLQEQAKGPILNPVEMAMPKEVVVLERLNRDTAYPRMFAAAFPGVNPPVSYDNAAEAIAAFERTLITRDRFDDFLKGNDQALKPDELRGLQTFLSTGCTACHNGPALGGNTFQKAGLIHPYENTTDLGRYDITKNDDDRFKFKVPSLRNVAKTGPYFHDGKVVRLEDGVRKMGWMQLGLELPDSQVQSLVAFLNTLSGDLPATQPD
jgi:cytochrome c peroxidase